MSKVEEFKLGDDEFVKAVDSVIFLGSKIDSSGDCCREIRRLTLVRIAMANLENIWIDKDVTIAMKTWFSQ